MKSANLHSGIHVVLSSPSRVSPDNDGDGEIDVKELDSTIRLYKRRKRAGELSTWRGNLDAQQDPVFPNWLIGRDDFQQVFSRQAENDECTHGDKSNEHNNGVPSTCLTSFHEDRGTRTVAVDQRWVCLEASWSTRYVKADGLESSCGSVKPLPIVCTCLACEEFSCGPYNNLFSC